MLDIIKFKINDFILVKKVLLDDEVFLNEFNVLIDVCLVLLK